MSRKIVLLGLFVVGVVFSLTVERCLADAVSDLEQADQYQVEKAYWPAEQLYEAVITNEPNTGYALKAQRGLVVVYILTERGATADTAIKEMVEDFAGYCEPNAVAAELFGIARQYEWSAQYGKASGLYQKILDDYPQSWYVNRADLANVRTNIMGLIAANKYEQAEAAIDKLLGNTELAGHADLAEALYDIAKRYNWSHKYEEAESMYLKVVQKFPESSLAGDVPVRVKRINIISLIESESIANADSAIGKFAADFSGQPVVSAVLYEAANKYEWTGKLAKAKGLYQQIVQQYSGSTQAGDARLDAAKVDIMMLVDSGEDEAVETALDELVADFNEHSGLASAVSQVAEQYQIKAGGLEGEAAEGELRKAVAIWEELIDELDDIVIVPKACCYAGDCYRKLGEYEKSAVVYQKVVDDYPGNSMAWHALFMVGRNYEQLKKAGTVSESIADAKIRAAYEQVVEDYPDCKAAKAAQWGLRGLGTN